MNYLQRPVLVFFALGSMAAFAQDRAISEWIPGNVLEEVVAGESQTISVELSVSGFNGYVDLWIVPALRPYVSIGTSNSFSVIDGSSYPVDIILSADAREMPKTVDGTIHVREGGQSRTIAEPLKVELDVIWPKEEIENVGIAVDYPGTWNVSKYDDLVSFSNVDAPSLATSTESLLNESYFEVRVRPSANPDTLTVYQWFDTVLRPLVYDVIDAEAFTVVDEYDAIQVDLLVVGGLRRHIFIAKGSDVIEVSYSLFAPRFLSTYSMMLNSLRIHP